MVRAGPNRVRRGIAIILKNFSLDIFLTNFLVENLFILQINNSHG